MKPNERVRAVYQGRTPDQVPLMLDLSHWYKKNRNVFFNLAGFTQVEQGLVDLHKQIGAVCYCEMGGFYSLSTDDPEVKLESRTEDGVFSTRITTPLGTIHEERVFNPASYSYGIRKYLLESTDDFPIVEFLMERLQCRPKWDLYRAWQARPRRVGLSLRPVAVLRVRLPDGAQHGRRASRVRRAGPAGAGAAAGAGGQRLQSAHPRRHLGRPVRDPDHQRQLRQQRADEEFL